MLLCVTNIVWDFVDLIQSAIEIQEQSTYDALKGVKEQLDKIAQDSNADNLVSKLQTLQDQGKIGFFLIKSDRQTASSSLPDQVSPDFQAVIDGKVRMILNETDNTPIAAYAGERLFNQNIVIGNFLEQNQLARLIAQNR